MAAELREHAGDDNVALSESLCVSGEWGDFITREKKILTSSKLPCCFFLCSNFKIIKQNWISKRHYDSTSRSAHGGGLRWLPGWVFLYLNWFLKLKRNDPKMILYRSNKKPARRSRPLSSPLPYLLCDLWPHLEAAHSNVIGQPPCATASRWCNYRLSCSVKSKSAEAWLSYWVWFGMEKTEQNLNSLFHCIETLRTPARLGSWQAGNANRYTKEVK